MKFAIAVLSGVFYDEPYGCFHACGSSMEMEFLFIISAFVHTSDAKLMWINECIHRSAFTHRCCCTVGYKTCIIC